MSEMQTVSAFTRRASDPCAKKYDRLFTLRVSGKGDVKGAKGQVDFLEAFQDLDDVKEFQKLYEPALMSASSKAGQRLRDRLERGGVLKVLSREGRRDFLGVLISIGRSRFLVYASTAAGNDEIDGTNAFTRHLRDAIEDPAFTGLYDPQYSLEADGYAKNNAAHPRRPVVYAFDATRIGRTQENGAQIYEAVKEAGAVIEAGGLLVDPGTGPAARMMWEMLTFGSEMEQRVGKLRRFVGRLNTARAGYWPFRIEMAPLGVTAEMVGERRRLVPDPNEVAAVTELARVGLDPNATQQQILAALAAVGVCSRDPKTAGVPVDQLDPAAARRFFTLAKLRGYRDGQLALEFVGVVDGHLNPGSGHELIRRWHGANDRGERDKRGSITYSIPMPKPTVLDHDRNTKLGWLPGVSEEDEYRMWTRLIALRGVDRLMNRIDDLTDHERALLSSADLAKLAQDVDADRARTAGGRKPTSLIKIMLCAGQDRGARIHLRSRAGGASYELRREKVNGDRKDKRSGTLLATMDTRDVLTAMAEIICLAVDDVTSKTTRPLTLAVPPAVRRAVEGERSSADDIEMLQQRVDDAERLAEGYDKSLAVMRGDGAPAARIRNAEQCAKDAWREHEELLHQLDQALHAALDVPNPGAVSLEVSSPLDVVSALRAGFRLEDPPTALVDAMRSLFPEGLSVTTCRDRLSCRVTAAAVSLATTAGQPLVVRNVSASVPNRMGRGAAGESRARASVMAARRLGDGVPMDTVARAASYANVVDASRKVTEHLQSTGKFPSSGRLQALLDCPIAATTKPLHQHLTTETSVKDPFQRHVVEYFTTDDGSRRGSGSVWSRDCDTQRRQDQLTILAALAPAQGGMAARDLAFALDPDNDRLREVLHASNRGDKVTMPPATYRLPTAGFPHGWFGKSTSNLAEEDKRISLMPCPYPDCAAKVADVLCMAGEVLALGGAVLCRRCRRVAVPSWEPQHAVAKTIRFPQAYIDWADAQPRRSGRAVPCGQQGCCRDVGFGPGLAWRWADSVDERAWHDDDCRAGQLPANYVRCHYVDCELDDGGGPGSIRRGHRASPRWHGPECSKAANGIGRLLPHGHRETEAARIRGWAAERGIQLKKAGRVPRDVVAEYREAMGR